MRKPKYYHVANFYRCSLYGGKKHVVDEDSQPILQKNGLVRMGREFAESTFRKIYHALRTIHVHFQRENEYKVSQLYMLFIILMQYDASTGRHVGNSCNNPSVIVSSVNKIHCMF